LQRFFLRLDFGDGIRFRARQRSVGDLLHCDDRRAPMAFLIKGNAAEAQKKLPEARASFRRSAAIARRGTGLSVRRMKAAPDEASAKHVEARIWALWMQTRAIPPQLLMSGQGRWTRNRRTSALKLLDAVVKLRPDYVEGWNRRATLFIEERLCHSLEDIEQVLSANRAILAALAGSA